MFQFTGDKEKKRGKLGYSLFSSDSIPYKCFANIEFNKGPKEPTTNKIASSNQFDDSRKRVLSMASLMIPTRANRSPGTMIMAAAILHRLI